MDKDNIWVILMILITVGFIALGIYFGFVYKGA